MMGWLAWYVAITLLGWLAFPLAYRLLPILKDRGYAISRTLGLLIWGFCFWLLASLGALPFNTGGLLFAAAVLVGLSIWALSGDKRREILDWLRAQKRVVVVSELLFLVAFAGWAAVRAANPEAIGTEKPMELAFINAILRSPTFPPHDPWLSGYAISYYYFGYVLTAMLAKITATAGSVAFNLGISLVFALSACGAYGLVYNLLNAFTRNPETRAWSRFTFAALLGPFYVLIVSNLEGFLQMLHDGGLFWQRNANGVLTSPFWSWLGILDLNTPPQEPFSFFPTRFWWWWRASRVLIDYDLKGASKEIIDEFPFFSYLLADLHPHVLAMPFAFLAMTLALNVFLSAQRELKRSLPFKLEIEPGSFLLAAISLGGMAFLNTWDFPVYVFIFAAAYALGRVVYQGANWAQAFTHFIWMGVSLGVCGVILYLPFYLGFSSQAGGILPNLVYPTRGAQFWVMFAPLLLPIFGYLTYQQFLNPNRQALLRGLAIAAVGMLGLWVLSLLMGWGITLIPEKGQLYLSTTGADNASQALHAALARRVTTPGTWLTLLIGLGLILSLVPRIKPACHDEQVVGMDRSQGSLTLAGKPLNPAAIFALLLALTGLLLVLIPEFFYLLDMFGWRMNTIFKFYFEAWLIWSIAAAFSVIMLVLKLKGLWSAVFRGAMILVFLASLAYPALSLINKTNAFQPAGWTLDSTAYFAAQSPDEMAAIDWLKKAPYGVVAEAVPAGGGSYTEYARVSTLSGLPAVLGWIGHENQWRGSSQALGTRQSDLQQLYCTRDWDTARQILNRYAIRYVFVGNLERSAYQADGSACLTGLVEAKFSRNLNPVFKRGTVTIFEYTGAIQQDDTNPN